MKNTRIPSPSPGRRILGTLLVLLVAAMSSATARAGSVRATLVADVAAVTPHSEFWVGLHFQLRPGWHTYWSNPGDSGLAAALDWELPEGIVAGAVRWPIPRRFRTGDLTTYGYADEVVLLTRMSAWPGIRGASTVPLVVNASWLVCAEVCVPEQGRFELSLPVAPGTPPSSRERDLIERYRARLPAPADPASRFRATGDALRLRVPFPDEWSGPADDVWFYPLAYGEVEHGAPQPARIDGGALVVTLARGDLGDRPLERLRGVLVLRAGDDARGISVDAVPE